MTIEEATDFLSDDRVAHLGLATNGKPHVTPMAFGIDDGLILFRSQPGRKLEAIAENPAVCIEVCSFDESTGDWQSVIVNGRAAEVTDLAMGGFAPKTRQHLHWCSRVGDASPQPQSKKSCLLALAPYQRRHA
jgi:nitroimidazol reductase NimA-like FMN-containing flavoprotein (pyridoxamine 5'-phosphate oxidase superfamily)